MPEVEIRPGINEDIEILSHLDHTYETEYVWQMDRELSAENMAISFREIHLPRKIKMEYPHSIDVMALGVSSNSLLVSAVGKKIVGYVRIDERNASKTVWIVDLLVDAKFRRKGIGRALLLSVVKWARHKKFKMIVIEIQSKNHPASLFALKCGFQFSGFHDQHYANQDIALFFGRLER
jgi:GNAT superfamily N-acetyltransferase